jgi:predicted Fe-S protein YdhL (DUF1289 family)
MTVLSPTNTPASPCINICRMNDASGLCDGCLRTIDEIAAWSTLDDEAKRAVWHAIDTRHASWMAQRFDAARTHDGGAR